MLCSCKGHLLYLRSAVCTVVRSNCDKVRPLPTKGAEDMEKWEVRCNLWSHWDWCHERGWNALVF